jgi:hypothetical protein
MAKYEEIAIDFEFNSPSNADMGLVSVSFMLRSEKVKCTYWLRDPEQKAQAKEKLEQHKGAVLIAYAVELAESRCVMALGINPLDFKWRDIMLEWRWLRNHDDKYNYGRIVQQVGGFCMIKTSCPPIAKTAKKASKAEKDDAEQRNFRYAKARGFETITQAGGSLLDCMVFFEVIKSQHELNHDWQRKNDVRNYIIAGVDLEARKAEILEYNESDIHQMFELADKLRTAIELELSRPCIVFDPVRNKKLGRPPVYKEPKAPFTFGQIVLGMGKWAAFNGYTAHKGLPLDKERCEQIAVAAPKILEETKLNFNRDHWLRYRIEDSNDRFPAIDHSMEDLDVYYTKLAKRRRVKTFPYREIKIIEDATNTQKWIDDLIQRYNYQWKTTDTGKWDTSSKYLEQLAQDTDDCPIKNYMRNTKAVDAINGLAKDREEGLWKTIGDDYIHRFKPNPYATQTARNGNGASSLIYGAPQWFRVMINPPEGKCLIHLDYASQEVFIAAAMPNDENYMETYNSGDPYWSYAVLTGAIPKEIGTPTEEQRELSPWKEYASVRKSFKQAFLSISFGCGATALALALTIVTGIPHTKEDGQKYLGGYAKAYPKYAKAREVIKEIYQSSPTSLYLSNGWRMGPSNPTPNSFLNLWVQGTGSMILQKACYKMYELGIDIRVTVHDDVGAIATAEKALEVASIMERCMIEAADEVLGVKGMRVGSPEIVHHNDVWMHSGRAKKDFDAIKHNFTFHLK